MQARLLRAFARWSPDEADVRMMEVVVGHLRQMANLRRQPSAGTRENRERERERESVSV